MKLNDEIARTLTESNLSPDILNRMKLAYDFLEERNIAPGIPMGEKAPDFCLKNTKGEDVCLTDYLSKGPVVVSFFRGEWCPVCNMELKAQQAVFEKIESTRASLLAISPQNREHNITLTDKYDITFQMLSDPEQDTIKKYLLQIEMPEEVRNTYLKEFGQIINKETADQSWNLPVPATFVLDQKGTVVARFVSSQFDVRMEPDDIVSSLRNITSEKDSLLQDLRTSNEVLRNTMQELRRTQEMLIRQEKRAVAGSLVGGLAHEIGNLLNPISFLEVIYKDMIPKHQKFFDYILDSRERIIDLTNEVRLMVKGEESHYATTRLDLNKLIEEAILLAKMDPVVSNSEIRVGPNPKTVVIANKNRIIQVFLNLLRNASQAIDRQKNGHIEISSQEEEGFIWINVSDNGHGMDESRLKRIWEPFFSTKGEHGTGLGLDICKKIIEGHGGEITCQSEIGAGTRFAFSLPLEHSS